MHNLKRMIAGLMVAAVVATSAVPAFAVANPFSYEAEADQLHEMGLFQGVSQTTFDPALDMALDRQTGIVMLMRIIGMEDEALAMTDAEANAALAQYTDKNDIADWAKKQIAHAVEQGLVQGMSATTMAPKANLNGKMYATMILRNIGYTVDATDYSIAAAILAEKGGLTAAEAVRFNEKALIRDDLVGISFGSLSAVNAAGDKLIATLVEAGVVTEEAAVAAGIFTARPTPTPAPAAMVSAAANNLKAISVSFNKAIDSTTFTFTQNAASSSDNVRIYNGTNLVNINAVEVAADKMSAVIYTTATLGQDTSYKVVLSNVKAGTQTIAGEMSFTAKDITSPSIASVQFTAPTKMVITFSEPMVATLNSKVWSAITIDGVAAAGSLANTANGYKYTMTLSSAVAVGDHAIVINNTDADLQKDLAGFMFAPFSGTVNVAADTAAPQISSLTVDRKDKITVVFNENLDPASINNSTFTVDNNAWNASVSGATVTLTKNAASLSASALSGATLRYTAVKDYYGNSTGATALTYGFTTQLDSSKPTATVALNSDNTFTVEYSKAVDNSNAQYGAMNLANSNNAAATYVLKNKDGVVVSAVPAVTEVTANKKYTVSFSSVLGTVNAANYSLTVQYVKDMTILGNMMDAVTFNFTANDTSAPTASAPALVDTNKIKIVFDEAMDAATLANKDNYIVNLGAGDKYLSAITDSAITVAADNKSVVVTVPGIALGNTVKILAVKDSVGKLITNLNATLTVVDPNAFVAADIASVNLTALNQVKITLDAASANTFDAASASIANNWKIAAPQAQGGTESLLGLYVTNAAVAADGKSVTLTISENITADATKTVGGVVYNVAVYTANATSIKDTFGKALSIAYASAIQADDTLAPTATVATGDATGEIKITFNEAVTAGIVTLTNNTTGAVVAVGGDVAAPAGNFVEVTAGKAYKITGLTSGNSYTVTTAGVTDGTNTAAAVQTVVVAK